MPFGLCATTPLSTIVQSESCLLTLSKEAESLCFNQHFIYKHRQTEFGPQASLPNFEGGGNTGFRQIKSLVCFFTCHKAVLYIFLNRLNKKYLAFFSMWALENRQRAPAGQSGLTPDPDWAWLSLNRPGNTRRPRVPETRPSGSRAASPGPPRAARSSTSRARAPPAKPRPSSRR